MRARPHHLVALTCSLLLAAPAVAAAQDPAPVPRPLPLPSYVTDGPVRALASAGGRVFVGGAFSRIGPQTGGFGAVDQGDGSRVARLPIVGGAVYAMVSDGAGGYYIGGAFGSVGGVPRSNLAHVLADGTVDPGFDPSPDHFVFGLAVVGDRLFVGGNFVRMGSEIRRRLAAVRIPSGELDQQFNPGADGPVGDILPVGDRLLVNGGFRGIAGTSRRGFAAIDQVEGGLVAGYDVTPDGNVNALHRMGDRIFLGGAFDTINGRSRSGLAALDAETGELDETFAPAVNGNVTALADDGERLFVGGGFTEIAQTFDNGVASLDPETGRASPEFRFFAQGTVGAIAIVGGEVFVGGNFRSVNEQPVPRLAVADKVTGAVRPGFAPDPNGDIYALLANGSELAVAGTFSSVPRAPAGNLAALDAATGVADPAFQASVGGEVTALATAGSRLIVGGRFGAVNTVTRTGIADVDQATGTLGDLAAPVRGDIQALAVDGGDIYVGGALNDQRHWGLVRLRDGRLDDAFNRRYAKRKRRAKRPPLLDRYTTVSELLLAGDRLYVGGSFTRRQALRGSILAVDTRTDKPVRAFRPRMSGAPDALAVDGDALYVGGNYVQRIDRYERVTLPDGKRRRVPVFRTGLFALDAADGDLRRAFAPVSPGGTLALEQAGRTLFAGGGFGRLNGLRVDNLGAVDAGSGVSVTGYTPEPLQGSLFGSYPGVGGPPVSALEVAGGRLYAGGAFNQVGFLPQAFLAAFPLEPAA